MTDYYVNGSMTSGIFDKLLSNQSATMTNGDNLVTTAAFSPLTGNTIQIETVPGNSVYETYELTSIGPPRIHELWSHMSNSGFDMRFGHGNGQSEVDAFPTIFTAMDNASGNDRIFLKWINGGYKLSRAEQTLRTIESSSGDLSLNKILIVEGYKDNIGDMYFGSANYQSIFNAFVNGIDTTKRVVIDGLSGIANLLEIDGVECVTFRNIIFKNCTGNAVLDANVPNFIRFENCIFEDINKIIDDVAETFHNMIFLNCYFTGIPSDSNIAMRLTGTGNVVHNCILQLSGTTIQGILTGGSAGIFGGNFISNTLILNGGRAIRLRFAGHIVKNCIIYNPVTCIDSFSSSPYGSSQVFNNILMPKDHNAGAVFRVQEASFNYNDYNCIWSVDGQAMDLANIGVANGAEIVPVVGPNSIQADPLMNANYQLLPGSPCLNTGIRSGLDGYSNMGAFQNLQLTRQRLRNV